MDDFLHFLHLLRQVNPPVPGGLRGQHAKLDGVQGRPGVSACDIRQKIRRFVGDLRLIRAHAPLFIRQSPVNQFQNI